MGSPSVPVVLHVGAAKTATTTLQKNIFARLPGITYLGKPNPLDRGCTIRGLSPPHYLLLERIGNKIVREKVYPRDDIRELRNLIERLEEFGEPIIYSNELLSDNKCVSFEEIAKRLREGFGDADLIFTVRDPLTALPSMYLHEMRDRLCDIPFTVWLDEVLADPRRTSRLEYPLEDSLEQYQYASAIPQFRSAFDGRMEILKFEDLTANPIKFACQLADFLSIDVKLITSLLKSAPKNAAKSADWYRYQRSYMKIKKIFPTGLLNVPLMNPVKQISRRVLDGAIDRVTSKQPSKSVELSDHDRQRIEQFFGIYAQELATALRKIGLHHDPSAVEGPRGTAS